MAINSGCTPQCGIRANAEDTLRREGHYNCPQDLTCRGDGRCGEQACSCDPDRIGTSWVIGTHADMPWQEVMLERDGLSYLPSGIPMCDRR